MDKQKMYLLDVLKGKWRVLILEALFDGSKPFTDLQRELKGITAKVLTENLYFLVKSGILVKRSYPVFPPRVEYSLSDTGEKIKPILNAIYAWSLENYTPPTAEVTDGFYGVFK